MATFVLQLQLEGGPCDQNSFTQMKGASKLNNCIKRSFRKFNPFFTFVDAPDKGLSCVTMSEDTLITTISRFYEGSVEYRL